GDLDILLTGTDSTFTAIAKVYRNNGGSFSDSSAVLEGVWDSSVAWGDYDNDGDLDILLAGFDNTLTVIAKVYENQVRTGNFADISATLDGVIFGGVAWGDYDNDGDQDILLTGADNTGSRIAKVYRNDGGSFVDISATLDGVALGSVAWGDYDNDGDLDILLTGGDNTGTNIAKVYRNDGGSFVDIGAALDGVRDSSVAWGDYDNDGDLDILLTGFGNTGIIAKVYRNDGGSFVDISAALDGVLNSSVAWGDYDNDGDLDILLTGSSIAKVYRNDDGSFVDISAALDGVTNGDVAWGDYDNDGDLDILLTGTSNTGPIAKVYRNDGGSFVDISAALEGVALSSVAWGDYDNDGDLDILLTGLGNTNTYIAKVYRNDGGSFVDISATLDKVVESGVAWGDYDNDGDLDILLIGQDNTFTGIAKVYENQADNTAPTAPASLMSTPSASEVTLHWAAASDTQTPTEGLSYNIGLGRVSGENDLLQPMAFSSGITNGLRLLPALGNAQQGLTTTLILTTPGTYYWRVQALDTAFVGSPFSSEASFTIAGPIPSVTYLPLLFLNYPAEGAFATVLEASIPGKPVTTVGETFFQITLSIPTIASTGSYHFSSNPNSLQPVVVDDVLEVVLNGTVVYSHDFAISDPSTLTPAVLDIPAAAMTQISGQTVTFRLRDLYGSTVSSTPIYIVYQPQ
ncbi:MAG: VCBS repeat-containing protein, partial [Chloroflexota bacterium]